MKPCFFLFLGLLITMFVIPSSAVRAQTKDSVYVIEQLGLNPYECCYGFILQSRQPKGNKIDEFRVKIIEGRGVFLSGQSSSPFRWNVFQSYDSVQWFASTASAELDSGQIAQGFNVCARHAGVMVMVWETYLLGELRSRDTIRVMCIGRTGCDEPFFRTIPSGSICAFDADLIAGNPEQRVVNDFHVRIASGGVTFNTSQVVAQGKQPAGWTRFKTKTDSLSWRTINNGLTQPQFTEGFRFFLDVKPDSAIIIEWWTTNFGEVLCRGFDTLQCGVTAPDSVQFGRIPVNGDSCCLDMQLRNTHRPQSPLTGFAVKILTPKTRFSSTPTLPQNWTTNGANAAGDSIYFSTPGLATKLSALFRGICFDNNLAATDTVRFRVETFNDGISVTKGTGQLYCERKIVFCDSITATVDSTYPSATRCIRFAVNNSNSRSDEIEQVIFRFSNLGKARAVLSASGPPGWQAAVNGNTVLFSGSIVFPGEKLSGFSVCLSLGDSTTKDPLNIYWKTLNTTREICDDTIKVNAIITRECDNITAEELPGTEPQSACFTVKLNAANQFNKPVTRFSIAIPGTNVIFTSATTPTGWRLADDAFPLFDLDFNDGNLPIGGSVSTDVCLNVSQLGKPPFTIPVVWTTYNGTTLICQDTLRMVYRGKQVDPVCDTISIANTATDPEQGKCTYAISIKNRHNNPAGAINRFRLRITGGKGGFADADPGSGGWTRTVERNEVQFTGGTIPAGGELSNFTVVVDSSDGDPIRIEAVTLLDGTPLCATPFTISCQPPTTDAPLGEARSERWLNITPNPATHTMIVSYRWPTSGVINLYLRDATGGTVLHRSVVVSDSRTASQVQISTTDIPSGIYYLSLDEGRTTPPITQRVVVVR
ncbi:MAG: T9SS type A sorting domain-containing protein [Armatimonadetes bacterium]|nr:T9SS type A sorting domain-containing protein [Armatimonadota bacterium]